ncbi:MAG: 6-phosphogluconolactonase, partial [Candidatus Dormiibacterota bacterium]
MPSAGTLPPPRPIRVDQVDRLRVELHADRDAAGLAAANRVGALLTDALRTEAEARVVLASAPSQAEFLAALPRAAIEWARVEAFHMDEYLGIAPDSPHSFSQFLRVHLFGSVEPGAFHVLDGTADPAAEAERYTR